jgi:gluconolactonase
MEFTRRDLTAAAGATAATTFTRTALGGWEPSERYPDPAIQILDPSFAKYRLALAGVERLATGMRWCEGQVYFGDARCLLWSDIPNNRIMRWDEGTGRVSVYRQPSNNANGNTRDRQGRLVTCEPDTRRVTRTEYDGTITVLIDKFDGKPLNSPNDVVVKSDDSVWFTDRRSASSAIMKVMWPHPSCRQTSIGSIRNQAVRRWRPVTSTGRTGSLSRPTRRSFTLSRRA